MNNMEKVKAKIKQQMKETDDSQFGIGGRCMCRIILDFIDSLSEEKPSKNLKEIAGEWAENEAYGKSDAEFEMAYKGFKAGAKWAMQQLKEEHK